MGLKALGFLLVWFAALTASPAFASGDAKQADDIANPCLAYGDYSTGIEDIIFGSAQWQCGEAHPSLEAERVFLRFDIPENAVEPQFFISRISPMKGLSIATITNDGSLYLDHFTTEDFAVTYGHEGFWLRTPEITGRAKTIIVVIDEPTLRITLTDAHLSAQNPNERAVNLPHLLVLSAICGVLLIPLIFSLFFYRVLRQDFVLWHATMATSLLCYILATTGLWTFLFNFTVTQLNFLIVFSFGASVAAAAMFMRSYIEPGKLHPALRSALLVGAFAIFLTGIVRGSSPFLARSIQPDIYYLVHLPIVIIAVASILDSLRRGSRSIKFLILAWSPVMVVGLVRLFSQVTGMISPTDAASLLHFGVVIDVLATSMGVMDRFMLIKRERDRARAKAVVLENLADQDPLTGLMNRRAVVREYARLREEGFRACALLDLDRFKDINDRFGHAIGDKVLCAVATALMPDDDTLVVRMGGEEFMLLLRGSDSHFRAEHRRRMISSHVASNVDALDRVVTASMGIVELPHGARDEMTFGTLYARADKLLYEAKEAGRNRTLSEKITLFGAAQPARQVA
ncbi:MAG: diguanylate cyclase domain-containing protein [Sphingomonadaceae bacterium]